MNSKVMNSQTSTIQTKVQANKTTAESIENISKKRLLKIKTYKMTFPSCSIEKVALAKNKNGLKIT